MPVEIEIEYNGNLRSTATHKQSGTTIVTDAPLDNGGKGEKFSPTDLVATALGTCAMTIMGLVAERSNIDLRGTKINVLKEMVAKPARRVGKIIMTICFPKGLKLSDVDRARLEKAADSCPVRESLHPDVDIETKFRYAD